MAGEVRQREPEGQGRRAGEPRPVHLGRHAKDCYETTLASSTRRSPGSTRRRAGKPVFGGAVDARRCRPTSAAPSPPRLMPEIRGAHRQERAQGRPFRRQRRGAGVRQLQATSRPLAALGTSCPDHFLRTKIRPLVLDFDPADADLDDGARRPRRRDRRLSRRLRRLLRALQARRQPGDARPQRGRLPGPRRRHDHLCPRQGDGAHRRRVLRQRHQRDARRLGGRHLCRPARAGGLRHRVLAARGGQAAAHAEAEDRSPAASPSSPAAPAASAGRPPRGCWPRAPASCSPTSTRRRSTRPRRASPRRYGKDSVRGVGIDVTDEAGGRPPPSPRRCRRVRRPRHPRLQCRHRLLRADRGDDADALEQEHRHPRPRAISSSRARPSG